MVDATDISQAKGAIDGAVKAFSKVDNWAKDANKLAMEGQSLNVIQGALKDVKVFGQVSSVLGFASIGLEIALKFMGGPSPDDIMMQKLDGISNQINDLWTHIDNNFKDLANNLTYQNAQSQLKPHWDFAVELREDIQNYADKVREKDPNVDGFADLVTGSRTTDDCLNHARGIRDSCKGDNITINILSSLYDYSQGNMSSIAALGTVLQQAVLYLAYGHSQIGWLQHCKKIANGEQSTFLPVSEIHGLYEPIFDDISSSIDSYVQKCRDEFDKNLDAFFARELPQLSVKRKNVETATELGEELKTQWSWLDWMVLVYEPVSGWDMNGFYGWGKGFKRHKFMDGTKTLILSHAPQYEYVTDDQIASVNDKISEASKMLTAFTNIAESTRVVTKYSVINDYPYHYDETEKVYSGTDELFTVWNSGESLHHYYSLKQLPWDDSSTSTFTPVYPSMLSIIKQGVEVGCYVSNSQRLIYVGNVDPKINKKLQDAKGKDQNLFDYWDAWSAGGWYFNLDGKDIYDPWSSQIDANAQGFQYTSGDKLSMTFPWNGNFFDKDHLPNHSGRFQFIYFV